MAQEDWAMSKALGVVMLRMMWNKEDSTHDKSWEAAASGKMIFLSEHEDQTASRTSYKDLWTGRFNLNPKRTP